MLCRILTRKVAPPAAKKLIYNLCLKSQMRYPAGLAPWTPQQYDDLDKVPTVLLRQIYGLRRCFPTDLLYAPSDVGGCGESRLSDVAQLQKWLYLHSLSHLNSDAADVVINSLIFRATQATITDTSYNCSSRIAWGRRMGLTLHQAPHTPLPDQLAKFLASATSPSTRSLFTDGSFTLDAPLLDMLSLTATELSTSFAKAATGIYLPSSDGAPAVALLIRTQRGDTTGAYYQELLGLAIATLVSTATPLKIYSDCSSAIRRATQAASLLGTAVGVHYCRVFVPSP